MILIDVNEDVVIFVEFTDGVMLSGIFLFRFRFFLNSFDIGLVRID